MNPDDVLKVLRFVVDLVRYLGIEDALRDHLNAEAAARADAVADAAEAAKFGPRDP